MKYCKNCDAVLDQLAKVCSNCGIEQPLRGMEQSTEMNANSGEVSQTKGTDNPPRSGRAWVFGVFLAILALLYAMGSREGGGGGEPGETDAVAACNVTLKSYLVSRSSFDTETMWQFNKMGQIGYVTRDYEATNSFGAKISSKYVCQYDFGKSRVVYLATEGPLGATELINNP